MLLPEVGKYFVKNSSVQCSDLDLWPNKAAQKKSEGIRAVSVSQCILSQNISYTGTPTFAARTLK